MNEIDHLALDARLLNMFVAVYEAGSITKAAVTLDVTQSTVSHGMNRLRKITGDELFVPMGRSIAPTVRADQMIPQARHILNDMKKFTQPDQYDPATDEQSFSVAANDYEIEVIVKPFIRQFRKFAPKSTLHVLRAYSQTDWAELLRSGQADLALSPELETGEADLRQQKLLTEKEVCFYDPKHRSAPDTLERYRSAPHANMSLGRSRKTNIDEALSRLGYSRRIAVSLPSFSAVASIMQDTDIIATMPERLMHTLFKDFRCCDAPVKLEPSVITCTWHIRNNASPRHRWLRSLMRDCV